MKFKVIYFFILFALCNLSCSSEKSINVINVLQSLDSHSSSEISFMHISDTHGSSISVVPMVEALNSSNCDFGIITGDILPDDNMINIINSYRKPVFLVPGNHDAYDVYSQYGFRKSVIDRNTTISNVKYGDNNANYFYYDLHKDAKHFRVISLDQFELDAVGRAGIYEVVMSQKQIDWFIEVLESSYNVDAFIVLIHEGFGNANIGSRDIKNVNKFVSGLAADYTNSYDFNGTANPLLIPDILHAYISGENIINKTYASGIESAPVHVTTKFNGAHHNFIAYYGGHLHWDEVEYLNTHQEQLLSLIAYGGQGTGSGWNDLVKSNSGEDSYNINYNKIDIEQKQLTIYRLGAKNTQGGTIRDSITFEILK